MTPLRQRRIEDMQLLNFASTTQRSYIHYVADFAKQYQLHLAQERKLSPQSVNTFVSAVPFLYLVTLEMPWDKRDFPRARLEQKLPVVLAPTKSSASWTKSPASSTVPLLTCYGSGLRISEAVSLQLSDIDNRRMLIRVEHGKGGKDRYTMLAPCLLEILRLLPHPTCACLPEPCKPSAAKPGGAAACANAPIGRQRSPQEEDPQNG